MTTAIFDGYADTIFQIEQTGITDGHHRWASIGSLDWRLHPIRGQQWRTLCRGLRFNREYAMVEF